MQWQPIETAPKDGSVVLLYLDPPLDTNGLCGWVPQRSLHIVAGWAEGWGEYADRNYLEWHAGFCEDGTADTEGHSMALQVTVYPTHWMALPEPPNGAAQ